MNLCPVVFLALLLAVPAACCDRSGGETKPPVAGSVGAGLKFKRRRSLNMPEERSNHPSETSPCNFFTYDFDKDGKINFSEILDVMADNDLANKLFRDLDITGDEVVTLEEFNQMAPKLIYECGKGASENILTEKQRTNGY